VHGAAFLVRLRLVVQWGLEQRSQHGVGRGSEVVEKSLGDRQLRLRDLVDQPM
jgi:hypothetical protein